MTRIQCTCISTHLRRLRHPYHLNNYIPYNVSSTSSTSNKTKKLKFILYIFYSKSSHPPPYPTHRVPFSTRSYTCGTRSSAWICTHPTYLQIFTTVSLQTNNTLLCVRHVVPALVTTNPTSQLDVPWLKCYTSCMDCQEVCILQQGNEIVLTCLM